MKPIVAPETRRSPRHAGGFLHASGRRAAACFRVLATVAALGTAGTLITGCAATATSQSTGEYIDDAAITAKVKAALIRDPIVPALEVGVDTYKGVVQLNGFVDTADEKMRAEQIARNIPGVVAVQNKLTVKTAVTPPVR